MNTLQLHIEKVASGLLELSLARDIVLVKKTTKDTISYFAKIGIKKAGGIVNYRKEKISTLIEAKEECWENYRNRSYKQQEFWLLGAGFKLEYVGRQMSRYTKSFEGSVGPFSVQLHHGYGQSNSKPEFTVTWSSLFNDRQYVCPPTIKTFAARIDKRIDKILLSLAKTQTRSESIQKEIIRIKKLVNDYKPVGNEKIEMVEGYETAMPYFIFLINDHIHRGYEMEDGGICISPNKIKLSSKNLTVKQFLGLTAYMEKHGISTSIT